MSKKVSHRYLPVLVYFPVACSLLLVLIFSNCINQPQSKEIKRNSRNLQNSTTCFIYNVIPDNSTASISPEYSIAINTFSVKLLHKVYSDTNFLNRNLVISPFSVSRCLAVITEGASENSREELLNALGGQVALDDATDALAEILYGDNSVIFQCADAMWIDSTKYSLRKTFKDTANSKYGVEVAGIDFNNTEKAVNRINNWVTTNTNHYITKVIDFSDIPENIVLLLVNALYFEADWTSPFNVSKTKPDTFYSPDGAVIVDMMSSGYHFETHKTQTYENAKLFYGTADNNFFYLDIYMPASGSIEDFLEDTCLSALSAKDPANFGSLQMPKFSFESEIDLIPMLKQLGINTIFNVNESHLTEIVQKVDSGSDVWPFISMIKHVAGIKTDEEGTKAYAVTGVIAGSMSIDESSSPNVILNKPFVYFIRAGKNGLVLFAGVVNDPGDG